MESRIISWSIYLFLILQACTLALESETRKFHISVNPGCSPSLVVNCTDPRLSLVHIKSDGPRDSLHFIWSFLRAPTLLLARTTTDSNLTIDWPRLLANEENTITFDPKPFYVFGWSLVKVWMYHDQNDTARIDAVNQTDVHGYDARNFVWERQDNGSVLNSSMVNLSFESKSYDHVEGEGVGSRQMGPQGFFRITIRMKNVEDYSTVLPYMMYNENNTQVDIAFNDVQLNTTADEYPKHPRVAFKYVMAQDNGDRNETAENMRVEVSKTLDDEHSPGEFQVFNVKTPAKGIDQSYIQWKPICYTAEIRDVIDSVDVKAYPIEAASGPTFFQNETKDDDNVLDTLLWSYFGFEIDNITLDAMNISFGTQGDGYYNKTKHISWTYSTGFGMPPPDRISLLVVLVVSIGLGIPALIILFSVIYMVCRGKQPRDDLLLGQ